MSSRLNHRSKRRKILLATSLLALPSLAWCEKQKRILLLAESNASNNTQIPINETFQKSMDFVEQELNLDFDKRRYPWKRLLQNLNEGEGLAFGLSKTKERMQHLHFSIPAFGTYIWLVTRSDMTFPYSDISDLKTKTVGIVRGSSYGEEFDLYKDHLQAVEEDIYSLPSRLKKLLGKRMDVMLIGHRDPDPAKVEALINKSMSEVAPETEMPPGISFKVLNKPLGVDYIHFAILAEKDDGIIERINEALRKAKRTGELPSVVTNVTNKK